MQLGLFPRHVEREQNGAGCPSQPPRSPSRPPSRVQVSNGTSADSPISIGKLLLAVRVVDVHDDLVDELQHGLLVALVLGLEVVDLAVRLGGQARDLLLQRLGLRLHGPKLRVARRAVLVNLALRLALRLA